MTTSEFWRNYLKVQGAYIRYLEGEKLSKIIESETCVLESFILGYDEEKAKTYSHLHDKW